MYQTSFFVIDTFKIHGEFISICVIQGRKEKIEVKLPPILQKNMVLEVPKNQVDLLSELMAAND